MGSYLVAGVSVVEGRPMQCAHASLPGSKLPYTVVMDALGIVAGGVLMQDQGDGPCTIAFRSRALKPTEQWYSGYERQLVAIAYCFIQWRHYLEDCPGGVTMITDHQPLTHLME